MFFRIHGLVWFLSSALLAGCQIHKPVPVEHLGTQSRPNTVYDARQQVQQSPVRSSPGRSSSSVGRGSMPGQMPEQSMPWTPITIDPIQNNNLSNNSTGNLSNNYVNNPSVADGPTQPLTEYQFKPRPRPASANQTNDRYVQQVAVNKSPIGSGQAHIVQRGENLYAIARTYGMSVQNLAAINDLRPPYAIYPNQKLQLSSAAAGATPGTPAYTTQPAPVNAVKASEDILWAWPASGELLDVYKKGVSNGIQIGGEAGVPIRASADGSVLYAGNEVTGYGELIIIDHGNGFMSTYAHNRKLLVTQGQQVTRGQKIAEMGSTEADRTKLHFEIRQGEKPVDPIAYLPKK